MQLSFTENQIFIHDLDKRLRTNDHVFLFSVKDSNAFGIHKASKEQQRLMFTTPIRFDKAKKLHVITPIFPQPLFLVAQYRLSLNTPINMVRSKLNNMTIWTSAPITNPQLPTTNPQ